MAIQFATALRNNRAAQIEATVGVNPILRIYTGAPPADPSLPPSGLDLVSYALAADWASAPLAGTVDFLNTPIVAAANNNGVAGYYRLYDNSGGTCYMQGTVAVSGGDLTIDNANIVNGEPVSVTAWSITEGNM